MINRLIYEDVKVLRQLCQIKISILKKSILTKNCGINIFTMLVIWILKHFDCSKI